MDRVTTFSAYNSVITNLMSAEVRQNLANVQVSSGKLASDLKGFDGNAEALTAAKTLKTRVDSFVEGTKTLTSKLDAQGLALTQVADAGTSAREAIANAVATGRADGLMSALQSFFSQAQAGLNTQYNGHYLFAGAKVDTPPVSATGMAVTFNNDQLAATSRLDESTTVQSGMLASTVGSNLFNAFGSIEAFNAGPSGNFNGQLTQAQSAFLTSMLQTYDAANAGMTDTVASNGLLQQRVDHATTQQQDRQTVLEELIGNYTDVDMAEAASRLSQSQIALQASAHIFASLQSTSLLNYLQNP